MSIMHSDWPDGTRKPTVSIGGQAHSKDVPGTGTAALTIAAQSQPALRITDGTTSDGVHFVIDDEGNVNIGADHNTDTAAQGNAKLYIYTDVNQAGQLHGSNQESIAFRIDSTNENILNVYGGGNSEFAAGQVYSHIYTEGYPVIGTHEVDWDDGNVQKVYLSGTGHTNFTFDNMKAGASYTLFIIQSQLGNHTVDFEETTSGGDIYWQSGVHPVLTTIPNAVDIITFVSDGTLLYGAAAYNFQQANQSS